MEIAKNEVAAIQATVSKVEESMKDVAELELALIGGGVGDVVLG